MKRTSKFVSSLLIPVALLSPLAASAEAPATLKDAYLPHFKIGTCINRSVATGQGGRRSEELVKADIALVKAQFNQVVAENEMKWMSLHPRAGKEGYDWTAADAFVEFGTKHNMELAGHTLVWHSQTPNWVFEGTFVAPGAAEKPNPPAAAPPASTSAQCTTTGTGRRPSRRAPRPRARRLSRAAPVRSQWPPRHP